MYKGLSVFNESAEWGIQEVNQTKTAIIFGIRSGTSMVAEMVKALGFYMGEGFQAGNEDNPRGYFEDAQVSGAAKSLADSIKANNIHNVPDEEKVSKVPFKAIRELKLALDDISRGRELWGFKRPGLLWYIDIIDLLVPNPYYILCTRDRRHVADSIQKHERGVTNKTDYAKFVNSYFDFALKALNRRNHIILKYEDTLAFPKKTAEELASFLDITDKNLIKEASFVVNSEYNHH